MTSASLPLTKMHVSSPQVLALNEMWKVIVSFSVSATQEHTSEGGAEWRLSEAIYSSHSGLVAAIRYDGRVPRDLSLQWLNIQVHLPLSNSSRFLSFLIYLSWQSFHLNTCQEHCCVSVHLKYCFLKCSPNTAWPKSHLECLLKMETTRPNSDIWTRDL